MNGWEQRQAVELRRCLASFDAQFSEWERRTERPPWEAHYSQVRAATALLSGLREKLTEGLARGISEDLELRVLSAWRVWEAFRSRLAQRQEEMFQLGLCAADEVAWACRKPIALAFDEAQSPGLKQPPKEPPLCYLSGSVSPSALARHRPFAAESVFAEDLSKAAAKLLDHLPVPLIGLPWHEIFHAPGLVSIAHETGHVVEADFQLTAALDAAMDVACETAGQPEFAADWKRWRAETFADHFAIRSCGPAYVAMLSDLLAPRVAQPSNKVYPPHVVRMELCFVALDALKLDDDAAEARATWRSRVTLPKDPHLKSVPHVVDQLGAVKIGRSTLAAVLAFDGADNDGIREVAGRLRGIALPAPQVGAHVIAAAAAQLFQDDPEAFVDEEATTDVCAYILQQEAAGSRRRAGRRRDVARTAASRGIAPPDAFQRYFVAGRKFATQWLKD